MDVSLEEGELSNDSDSYTPLKRPDDYSTFGKSSDPPQVQIPEPDSPNDFSSDSGSDSDDATIKQKRPKIKVKPKPLRKPGKQKYNVWSSRIQEEVLIDTLNTCDVTQRDRSRDVEHYDYPIREGITEEGDLRRILSRKHKSFRCKEGGRKRDGCEGERKERKNNKRTRDDRKNKGLRLVGNKRDQEDEEDDRKGAPRYLLDLGGNLMESSEADVAKELANKLFETRDDLLLKIVEVAGIQKSIEMYEEVRRIEKDGGMLIMNQTRRRTPGGVFFFLIKHDTGLTKDQHDKIFEEDRQRAKEELKEKKKKKKTLEKNKYQNTLAAGQTLPELLSKGQLCIEEIENKRWTNEKRESEHEEVQNPPPTPETDGPEDCIESKNVIDDVSGRQSQQYDEDFLDLGGTNDMDLF